MEKIFMKIIMGQGALDVIFNAYLKHPAFVLSDDDIISYLDHFMKILEDIENLLYDMKLLTKEVST